MQAKYQPALRFQSFRQYLYASSLRGRDKSTTRNPGRVDNSQPPWRPAKVSKLEYTVLYSPATDREFLELIIRMPCRRKTILSDAGLNDLSLAHDQRNERLRRSLKVRDFSIARFQFRDGNVSKIAYSLDPAHTIGCEPYPRSRMPV